MAGNTYEDYIPNLLDSMMTNLDMSDSNYMLIKHYNTFDLPRDYIMDFAKQREQVHFLYHSFDMTQMIGPFEPFLDWIKVLINTYVDESIDEFFERCNIYKLHRPIFKSYFEKGLCKRNEELIFGEIDFERKKFFSAIIEMFSKIAEIKPLVFVFNKIHAAPSSTIKLMMEFITSNHCKNIAILATYNEISQGLEYTRTFWTKLLEKFEEHDAILDWTLNKSTSLKFDANTTFKFNTADLASYYVLLNNMYCFLTLDQAEYYLDILYHKFEVEKVYIIDKYKFAFLELQAKIAMYQEKISDALLYCNGMRNIIENSDNIKWQYRCHYVAAQIHMYSYQQELARQSIAECKKCVKQMNQSYMLFKAELLEFMVEFWGWRSICMIDSDTDVDQSLLDKCIKYDYLNHISHIYVYSYDNVGEKFLTVENIDDRLVYFKKGIEIANKLGNEQFLIEAYKKNVMVASSNGYFDVANYFYEKCYEIVTANNDYYEEACIYNGMGYNCCTMEKYAKANEYFNKALLIFYRLNDVDAVNETIYNMAVNSVLAEDYKLAEQYLSVNLRIIKIMKANSVRVCNISKIYGLRAYCCYKERIMYNCKINMQYVEQFLGHIIEIEDRDLTDAHLWDDDLFLYYFVGALISEHENNLEEAYKLMKKADKYVHRSKGSMFLNFIPYSVGFARICRKMEKYDEAREILNECIAFCDERGYIYKKNLVKSELEGKVYIPMKWNLSFKGITLDKIVENAEVIGIERDFKAQKEEIDFLSIWQKIINNASNSIPRTIDNAVTTLKNNYNIDELTFIRMEDGVPVKKYDDSSYDMDEEKVAYLCEYFTVNRSEFATTRLDKGYVEHKELINMIFGFNSINTLICAPIFINEKLSGLFVCCVTIDMDWNYKNKRFQFDENDVSILMMLFRQLMDAIDRMEALQKIETINAKLQKANERLKEVAVRDNLTGLFNRQGFQEEMEGLIHRVQTDEKSVDISFLYADLDNFKYYNDTFGHDVGDIILKGFSDIITEICSQRGYAVRYGGDEFILVILSNDRAEIEKAAKDIYHNLQENKGFTKIISERLGRKVTIPKNKYISCSVGISDTSISPDNASKDLLEETLKKADAMMYYVKKTTKSRYVFYGDVKEDVDKIMEEEEKKEKESKEK